MINWKNTDCPRVSVLQEAQSRLHKENGRKSLKRLEFMN